MEEGRSVICSARAFAFDLLIVFLPTVAYPLAPISMYIPIPYHVLSGFDCMCSPMRSHKFTQQFVSSFLLNQTLCALSLSLSLARALSPAPAHQAAVEEAIFIFTLHEFKPTTQYIMYDNHARPAPQAKPNSNPTHMTMYTPHLDPRPTPTSHHSDATPSHCHSSTPRAHG